MPPILRYISPFDNFRYDFFYSPVNWKILFKIMMRYNFIVWIVK